MSDECGSTDDEQTVNGWITKRKRYRFLKTSAALYWGRRFTFHKELNLEPPFISNFLCHGMEEARVSAVVVSAANRNQWAFRIYDCGKFRSPPDMAGIHTHYIPCEVVMANLVWPHITLSPLLSYGISLRGYALVNRFIVKKFCKNRVMVPYRGKIARYLPKEDLYVIVYSDDTEDLSVEEVNNLLSLKQ